MIGTLNGIMDAIRIYVFLWITFFMIATAMDLIPGTSNFWRWFWLILWMGAFIRLLLHYGILP